MKVEQVAEGVYRAQHGDKIAFAESMTLAMLIVLRLAEKQEEQ